MCAVGVFDGELAAVVFVGRREKQRGGQIRAHPMRRQFRVANRRVDVQTEIAAALVAIEHRWKHLQRKGRGSEEGVTREGAQNDIAELLRHRVFFGELQIMFDLNGLVSGGRLAVAPVRTREGSAKLRHFGGTQDVGYLNQHESIEGGSPNGARLGRGRSLVENDSYPQGRQLPLRAPRWRPR